MRFPSLCLASMILVLTFITVPMVRAELGNTLENFHNNSRFVREFGFVFAEQFPPLGCFLETEDKYPWTYRYRKGAVTEHPSQVVLRTRSNPRIIGRQTLALVYPTQRSSEQQLYLSYFIEEATRRRVNAAPLIRTVDAYMANWYQQYFNTGNTRYETKIQGTVFLIELEAIFSQFNRQSVLSIATDDYREKVPCK